MNAGNKVIYGLHTSKCLTSIDVTILQSNKGKPEYTSRHTEIYFLHEIQLQLAYLSSLFTVVVMISRTHKEAHPSRYCTVIFCNVLKTVFEHNWFPLYAFKYSFLRRGPKVSPDSQRVPIGPRYGLHVSLLSYIALSKLYRSCTKSTIRYIHSTKAATVLPVCRHRCLC